MWKKNKALFDEDKQKYKLTMKGIPLTTIDVSGKTIELVGVKHYEKFCNRKVNESMIYEYNTLAKNLETCRVSTHFTNISVTKYHETPSIVE